MCALYSPRNLYPRVPVETNLANYLNRFQRFGLFGLRKKKELRSERRPECIGDPEVVYPDNREETDRTSGKVNADIPRRLNARH